MRSARAGLLKSRDSRLALHGLLISFRFAKRS